MRAYFTTSNKKNIFIVISALILLVGIFLRTYHFREWLYFYPDQARDVMITRDVLNGSQPVPLMGAIAASTPFKIGPMYYYFQILSGKIFGVSPETVAYPDLFFAILTIPLFYFFLRNYFNRNLSLALTGLFSVSYFAIKYSRFAWNSNPTPFFVLLFLMSLLEIMENKEKTSWKWILAAGISLGVGMQLHTVLLVLFPLTALSVFILLVVKNWHIWKKGFFILLVALVLNASQLASEINSNFHNTRLLFNISTEDEQSKSTFFNSLKWDTLCHIQANGYILSSLGEKEDCNFPGMLKWKKIAAKSFSQWSYPGAYLSIAFSILGYFALGYHFFREKESRKKIFLGVVILFAFLSYLVLFTVADILLLRYFIQVFFVPFVFLGLLVKALQKKSRIIAGSVIVSAFIFLIAANFLTIFSEAQSHFSKNRSNSTYIVLGELEPMRDYIISQSGSHNQAYLFAENKYMQNYFKPMLYVSSEKNFTIIRAKKPERAAPGEPLFFIGASLDRDDGGYQRNLKIIDYKKFGQIGVYKLKN